MVSKRILLIDDEEIVNELTETMLEALEHEVTSFLDAGEAYDFFCDHSDAFDLVITDQSMPAMTGVELACKIKEITSKMPIVISTGYTSQQIYDELENQESCYVLEKPFNMDQLEDIVDKACSPGKS